MKFIYSPEGAEPQEFPFEPDRLMSSEAEAIEKVTGMTFGEWRTAVLQESILAARALLWVCLKRQRPTLKFAEVEFRTGEVSIDLDEDETRKVLAELEKSLEGQTLTPEQEAAVAELREILAETDGVAADTATGEGNGEPSGKASSTPEISLPDVASTSGPSPTV